MPTKISIIRFNKKFKFVPIFPEVECLSWAMSSIHFVYFSSFVYTPGKLGLAQPFPKLTIPTNFLSQTKGPPESPWQLSIWPYFSKEKELLYFGSCIIKCCQLICIFFQAILHSQRWLYPEKFKYWCKVVSLGILEYLYIIKSSKRFDFEFECLTNWP